MPQKTSTQQPKVQINIKKYVLLGKICCWFALVYNIIEGIMSIILGEEESSISLVAFGAQSFIETASAIMVLIRFSYFESNNIKEQAHQQKDDEEQQQQTNAEQNDQEKTQKDKFLKVERLVTIVIGAFFLILGLVTTIVGSINLANEEKPSSTVGNIIISAIGLVFTIGFWYLKSKVAVTLNSSSIAGDAACNLACIKLSIALLGGGIIFEFWSDGWWIDSGVAILLSIFFFKEGYEMLKWGCSKKFDGGCGDCKGEVEKNKSYSCPSSKGTKCNEGKCNEEKQCLSNEKNQPLENHTQQGSCCSSKQVKVEQKQKGNCCKSNTNQCLTASDMKTDDQIVEQNGNIIQN